MAYEQQASSALQDGLDELMVLEQHAARRVAALDERIQTIQRQQQQWVEDVSQRTANLETVLKGIESANERTQAMAENMRVYSTSSVMVFVGTILLCLLLIAGSGWWANRTTEQVAKRRAELAALNTQLEQTPVVARVNGHDYIRVVRGSETTLINKGRQPLLGRYARVDYAR